MRCDTIILCLAALAEATITFEDPSDELPPSYWTADNAILADYQDASTALYEFIAITGPYLYDAEDGNITRASLYENANDTSVLVVANSSEVYLSHSTITKLGYSSDLTQAAFFGVNAAINIANTSTLHASHVNVTTHNGAANIYTYGTDSYAYVDHAWLYSSGPNAHGLYAAGNGTVYASNVKHYSGGNRASSFSGDSPAGYVHVSNSIAHTDGIGSAVCYALGLCNLTNVIGHASNAPVTFSDGVQTTLYTDSDVTAGLLAGVVLFSSSTRESGAEVTFTNSRLTVLGSDMPAIWFGNIIGTASFVSSVANNSASGILAIANMSQVTQDFDYFAGYEQNSAIEPAILTLELEDSVVSGDLVAYNGSAINAVLNDYAHWTGTAYDGYNSTTSIDNVTLTAPTFSVTLAATANWTLTANTSLANFTDADSTVSNVISQGYWIFYDASSSANAAWDSQTVSLNGGGYLAPAS
ncbi:hypothetical protein N0V82_005781 [Gnomoniopsis sp. IMI 355080]|nr:hypothetical protein N0V82_005781 [Gnomoniopsis sp. IMI 355080]